MASWDEERLAQELAEIADIDMTVFGFDEDDADLGDELLDNPYTTAPNSFIAQTMADKKDACFI